MPALADLGALLEQTALYDAADLGADLGAAHGGDPPGQFVLQANGGAHDLQGGDQRRLGSRHRRLS
jgi:hypothetical protein